MGENSSAFQFGQKRRLKGSEKLVRTFSGATNARNHSFLDEKREQASDDLDGHTKAEHHDVVIAGEQSQRG